MIIGIPGPDMSASCAIFFIPAIHHAFNITVLQSFMPVTRRLPVIRAVDTGRPAGICIASDRLILLSVRPRTAKQKALQQRAT